MIKEKLRKIEGLKIFYRKMKSCQEIFFDFLTIKYYKLKRKNIIFSHYARVKNFGDLFNRDLMDFFGIKLMYARTSENSEVALIGSILQMYKRDFSGFVLGSGFIKSRYTRYNNSWKVRLIRGPLSLSQCKERGNVIFGDPGILVSKIYPTEQNKKFILGIVPHSSDFEDVKKIGFGKNVKIINARKNPSLVAKDIQECKNIASSSLHGLIFADAYRIPNIHLKFGDKLIGGHHKFKDYYLGMGVEKYDYIDYHQGITMSEIISKCSLRFSDDALTDKQNEILEIFKKTINEILTKNKT